MSTVYHSFELSNSFELLRHINDSEILASPTVDNFHPQCHSSPRTTPRSITSAPSPNPAISDVSLSPTDYGLPRNNNMRTLIVNCNSIQGKSSEFKTVVHYIKPDIIIGTESKLGPDVLDSEVFPEWYVPYRKDRKRGGGGVFLAIKNCYPSSRIDTSSWEGNSEQVWACVSLKSSKDLFVGSFYRPPTNTTSPFMELDSILSNVFHARDKIVILGGDFNARGIDWNAQALIDHCDHPRMCEDLVQLSNDTGPVQIQPDATRESCILDLYFTNKPGLIKSHNTIPGISDHHMIVVDSDINQEKPRKVFTIRKADWDKAKQDTIVFADTFRKESPTRSISVHENWTIFKDHLETVLNNYVPSRTINGKPTLQ